MREVMREVVRCEEIRLWRDERGFYQVVGKSRERGEFVLLLPDGHPQMVSEMEPHLTVSVSPYKTQPSLFT